MEKGEVRWRTSQIVERFRPRATDPADLCESVGGWTAALQRFRTAEHRPLLLDRERAQDIKKRSPELVDRLIEVADRSADGSFQFFGHPAARIGEPIDWHHDPLAGYQWPDAPSHRIDHRVASGDPKWIWELNRLQHLPWLAQAWLFTGDDRYSRAAFQHLDTWIEQNPPKRGIAWRGAFEAGLRAISIAVALQGLRDSADLTPERYRRIVEVLAECADRCWRERSLFSSANNHLVGEMSGLAVVAMMFPELRSAAHWERCAVEALTAEADKQILSDGAGAEQSVGYQLATVELLNLVAALCKARDGVAPRAITDAVDRSADYLSKLTGRHDPDPRYGDHDQEFALRLGPEPIRTVAEHIGLVGELPKGDDGAGIAANSLSAEWFGFVGPLPTGGTCPPAEAPGEDLSFFAPAGGLVVLRQGGRRITMDVGNLGYLAIAAHGHADALAVTLSDDGADVIGDPGTGSYYQHPRWRVMMRGTRAHSTVCVDGADQSVIGGPFMWSQHAQVRVRGVDLDNGVVDAEHDGYTRLPGRVTHRRWLIAPTGQNSVLVIDLVAGHGTHDVRTCWPLHPSVASRQIPGGHALTRTGHGYQMLHAATAPVTFDDAYGDADRDLGWWSDRLESRVPAWWLNAVCNAELPIAIATLISRSDDADGVAGLEVSLSSDLVTVNWSEGSRTHTVAARIDRPAAVTCRRSGQP